VQAAVTAVGSSVLQALGELITFLICASLSCSGRTTYIGPAQPEQLSFRGELVCHVQHVRWHVPMSLVVEGRELNSSRTAWKQAFPRCLDTDGA